MQTYEEAPTFDFIVGRSVKCRVLERINHGSYGLIHKGILVEDGKKVVVKLERQTNCNEQVLREANIIRQLSEGPGIAQVFWYGLYDPFYNVLVMQELGQSLQQLFSYCDHKFTLDTVVMLACQILDILKYIHGENIVHRDIKPDNFLMGIEQNENKVYLIDFGLSCTYERTRALRRSSSISFQRSLVGTSRYASLHAHRGDAPLPRDDLESLGYCFVYFLKGSLPWQHMKLEHQVSREEHNLTIQKLKTSMTLDELCSDISPSISGYLNFARLLKPQDLISYERLKHKFASLSSVVQSCEGKPDADQFDWTRKSQATGEPIAPKGDRGHSLQSDK